jgi:hypothetical protein
MHKIHSLQDRTLRHSLKMSLATLSSRSLHVKQYVSFQWIVFPLWSSLALPVFISVAALFAFCCVDCYALMTPGNVLVVDDNIIYEYTADGTQQVGQIAVPGYDARDLVLDQDQNLHVITSVNISQPYLKTLNFNDNTWSSRQFPSWGLPMSCSMGGIASYGRYLFLTDMSSGDNGLIRVDIDNFSINRFAQDIIPADVNVGLDGLVYTNYPGNLYPGGLSVKAYDPNSLTLVKTLSLGSAGAYLYRDIAIETDGSIFAASWDGQVDHFDAAGKLIKRVVFPDDCMHDIDILRDGRIVIGNAHGKVFFTDRQLTTWSMLDLYHSSPYFQEMFVGFVVAPIPEPSTFVLLGIGALSLFVYVWQRRHEL